MFLTQQEYTDTINGAKEIFSELHSKNLFARIWVTADKPKAEKIKEATLYYHVIVTFSYSENEDENYITETDFMHLYSKIQSLTE